MSEATVAQQAVASARKAVRKAADTVVHAVTHAPETATASTTETRKGFFEMATAFSTTPEHVQTMVGDMRERAQSSMEKGVKYAEDFADFAKGNVEAMMASGRVAAKGMETMGREAADFGKRSIESATAAMKEFAGAKSPTEFFQLQSNFARSSFDAMVAEGSKMSEAWLKLTGEIVQPLSSRVAVAAEKAKATVA